MKFFQKAKNMKIINPVEKVKVVHIDQVVANDYNPNSVPKRQMELLYISIKEDGFCVEESTPILMADLTWKPAGQLQIGEKIIAFDEFATIYNGENKGRKQRRYKTALVEGNSIQESELLEVITSKGNVKVTPDHPFLAKRLYGKGHHMAEWVEARNLKANDIVIYTVEPWEVDKSYESGWLAGFLDGEGSLSQNQRKDRVAQTMRLSATQKLGEIADKMIEEMSKRVLTKVFEIDRSSTHPKWKPIAFARVDRLTDIMKLIGSVRPARLIKNGGEFWNNVALSSSIKSGSDAFVIAVKKVENGNIARLSTSTKTYIANGFAMHNTQPVVTIYDEAIDKYVIVDGFHRYTVMKSFQDIYDLNEGMLPIVVIEKDLSNRIASTIRHNRARGKHAVENMSSIVFKLLKEGWTDAEIMNKIGMKQDELSKLKHITGFSKIFAQHVYSKAQSDGI
jgi:hypothetical protein